MEQNQVGSEKETSSSLAVILIDSREKQPFNFRASANLAGCETIKLDHGDYQIKGHPDLITIERKNSITELCNNIGKDRDRFERELSRMQNTKLKYVIVEDYWSSVWSPKYTKLSSNFIIASIISFEFKFGIRFILAGNRESAHRITRELLVRAHKYRTEGLI